MFPRNKFKNTKGTLIARFPKNLHLIHFFKFISIYKQFITKLNIYSECTSNSLSPYTFTTVISYYLFTNIRYIIYMSAYYVLRHSTSCLLNESFYMLLIVWMISLYTPFDPSLHTFNCVLECMTSVVIILLTE